MGESHKRTYFDYSDPHYWHEKALKAAAGDSFARASKLFRCAIVVAPDEPLLRFDYGVHLVQNGQHLAADESFAEALRLRPIWPEVAEIRGKICRMLAGNSVSSNSLIDPANFLTADSEFSADITVCHELISAIDEHCPIALANDQLFRLADGLPLDRPELRVAIARRLSATLDQPNPRSQLWCDQKTLASALQVAISAVRVHPCVESQLTLAAVWERLGNIEHARSLVDVALQDSVSSRLSDCQLSLCASILAKTGDVESAVEMLQSRLKDNPLDVTLTTGWLELHRAIERKGDIARKLMAQKATPLRIRSRLLHIIGRREEACDELLGDATLGRIAQHSTGSDPIEAANLLKRDFDESFFASRADWGHRSAAPVFAFGTGAEKTLLFLQKHVPEMAPVYQSQEIRCLLGKHISLPKNIGECTTQALASKYDTLMWPQAGNQTKEIGKADIQGLAKQYLSNFAETDRRGERPRKRICDYHQGNIWFVPLIKMMFPKARILRFRQSESSQICSFLHNIFLLSDHTNDEIIRYSAGYQIIAEHWQRIFPDSFHVFDVDNINNTGRPNRENIDAICSFMRLPTISFDLSDAEPLGDHHFNEDFDSDEYVSLLARHQELLSQQAQ